MENDNFNSHSFLYNFSMIILLSLWLVYICPNGCWLAPGQKSSRTGLGLVV